MLLTMHGVMTWFHAIPCMPLYDSIRPKEWKQHGIKSVKETIWFHASNSMLRGTRVLMVTAKVYRVP